MPVGVFADSLFYFTDYWHPQSLFDIKILGRALYLESMVYGGLFGGIISIAYQVLCGVEVKKQNDIGMWGRELYIVVLLLSISVVVWYAGVNSIYATAFGAIITTLACLIYRRDLIWPAFWSGVIASGTMFIFYTLTFLFVGNAQDILLGPTTWLLSGSTLDVRLYGVPVTELVWGFSIGALIGISSSFVRNRYFMPSLRQ